MATVVPHEAGAERTPLEQAAALIAQGIALLLASRPAEEPAADELLTVAEMATALRRSPAFVRAACRSGAIKAIRDGRGYRARRSALAAYERRRTA